LLRLLFGYARGRIVGEEMGWDARKKKRKKIKLRALRYNQKTLSKPSP